MYCRCDLKFVQVRMTMCEHTCENVFVWWVSVIGCACVSVCVCECPRDLTSCIPSTPSYSPSLPFLSMCPAVPVTTNKGTGSYGNNAQPSDIH